MEIRADVKLLLALAAVLVLRVPLLNEAIQGDDVYYLYGAEHAQIEPAHPAHVKYIVRGDLIDMEGHFHPPLNAYILGGLLAAIGDIREGPFHAAYIVFSLIAVAAMWSLAQRFSPHPLWATLLFLATPAFVINGSSLESDLPFLAFWMAAIALFAGRRYSLAALASALAAMAAYQAIVLTPILCAFTWIFARKSRAAWAAALTPPLVMAAWQIYELASVHEMPALVLAGYFRTYGFQSLANKIRNAVALCVHAGWLVFPILLPPAFLVSRKRRDGETIFLSAWIVIFFAGGIGIFFAGSARYLLPMAAPVALLVSRLNTRWLAAGFAAQMAVCVPLAIVNFEHWDEYRSFIASLRPHFVGKRVWINGEWGLRYYVEKEGGLPMRRDQQVRPGDLVITSALAHPVHFTTAAVGLTPVAQREIRPKLPLRLIALDTRSSYSTLGRGFWPFDISNGPIDRLRAEVVVERAPKLAYLPMNAPETEQQLASGVYSLEGTFRWTAGQAVILLKSPPSAAPLQVEFMIHAQSLARRITLLLDDQKIAEQTYSAPGTYTLESAPIRPTEPTATITVVVDRTFSVPGDRRELGVVLYGAGFR